MDEGTTDPPFQGVSALDHTADVGLEVEAPDLVELLRRAVRGMAWLLLERETAGARTTRELQLEQADPPALLRELLRELLWWHDSEGVTAIDLGPARLEEAAGGGLRLQVEVLTASDPDPPVREIKGVTLHGLVVEPMAGGWRGKVIFDV